MPIHSFRDSSHRYLILRIVSILFLILGLVLSAIGVLIIASALAASREGLSGKDASDDLSAGVASIINFIAFTWALGYIFSGLVAIAISGLIRVAIHVEENTRATAQFMIRLLSGKQG